MSASGWGKVLVLARREYSTRVRSRGFWIGTLILPLFMAAMIFLPALILSKTSAEQRAVVVDETGRVAAGFAARLAAEDEGAGGGAAAPGMARVTVEVEEPAADTAAQRADLDRRVLADEVDAWIWITVEGLARDRVEYHAESVSNVITQEVIRDALSAEVRAVRLIDVGYDPAEVEELTRPVDLGTVRVSAAGSRAEAGEAGFVLAYGMFFLLYMILMIWGQQVLTGVLEEKSSRIVEVIVAAARPFELMMGKLVGIGAAGLTQLALWLAFVATLTAPGLLTAVAGLPEGISVPTLEPRVAVYYGIYFLLGFFVFSTLYAAIGAAFNNLQEAQHLAGIPAMLIIAPILIVFPVINDPGSTLAVAASLFPLFTPLLMPVRIAVEMPPGWQIALSMALTAISAVGMVWLCARIYRVGILMYGKKPTLGEMARWVRYD